MGFLGAYKGHSYRSSFQQQNARIVFFFVGQTQIDSTIHSLENLLDGHLIPFVLTPPRYVNMGRIFQKRSIEIYRMYQNRTVAEG